MRNARERRVSAKEVRRWIDSAAGSRAIKHSVEKARKISEDFLMASVVPQSSPVVARGPRTRASRVKS